MPIYDKPTKSLMKDWANATLRSGRTFSKLEPVRWFGEHYPKIKRNTVVMHVDGMSINNQVRKHHPNIRPDSGHDLFYKLGPDQYRLWNPESDGTPYYKQALEEPLTGEANSADSDDDVAAAAGKEFSFERDLRNYLEKNLGAIEAGLRIYQEEDIRGIEFPAGGRFIDILALDRQEQFVVIELKVSRGYDRVIGQLLRYMAWVKQNMESTKPVRGMIVANEITQDLRLAASDIPNVQLIEYEISFKLSPVRK